jgi:hypothetical protein
VGDDVVDDIVVVDDIDVVDDVDFTIVSNSPYSPIFICWISLIPPCLFAADNSPRK